MSILHNIFFFIVAIGVLVTFHEYGHYWVARKMGVKVLRFSVGFGKPLFTWRRKNDSDKVEYVIAAIPLGGYVKMMGLESESNDPAKSYVNKPKLAKLKILAAGVIFNFLFAIRSSRRNNFGEIQD